MKGWGAKSEGSPLPAREDLLEPWGGERGQRVGSAEEECPSFTRGRLEASAIQSRRKEAGASPKAQ